MKKTLFASLFVSVFLPHFVFAQTIDTLLETFAGFFARMITLFSLVAFTAFFWGIALFIVNVNDESKRQEGRSWMLWSVVALFVMVTIWGILGFLTGTFSVSPLPLIPLGS